MDISQIIAPFDFEKEVYPLTVIADRYDGTYSGGKFTAWNLYPNELPSDIFEAGLICSDFWNEESYKYKIGIGNTMEDAVKNLIEKIR